MTDGLYTVANDFNNRYKLYGDLNNPNHFLVGGSAADSVVYFEDLYDAEPRKIYGYTMIQYLQKVVGGNKETLPTEIVRENELEIHFTEAALELSARILEEKKQIQAKKDEAARLAAEYALPPLPTTDMPLIASAEHNAIADKKSPSVIAAINLAGLPRAQFDAYGIDQLAIDEALIYINKAKADADLTNTAKAPRTLRQSEWYEVPEAIEESVIAAATVPAVIVADDAPAQPLSSVPDDMNDGQEPISQGPIDAELAGILKAKLSIAVEFAMIGNTQSARDIAEEAQESAHREGYEIVVTYAPNAPISVAFVPKSQIENSLNLVERIEQAVANKAAEPPAPLDISKYSPVVIGGALEILERLSKGNLPLPPAALSPEKINLADADQIQAIRSILEPATRSATAPPLTPAQNAIADQMLYAADWYDRNSQKLPIQFRNDDNLNSWVLDLSNHVMSEVAAKQKRHFLAKFGGLFQSGARIETNPDADLVVGYQNSDLPDSAYLIEELTPTEIAISWEYAETYLREANAQSDIKKTSAELDTLMTKHIAREIAQHPDNPNYKIALGILAERKQSSAVNTQIVVSEPAGQDTSSRASFVRAAAGCNDFEPTALINSEPEFQPTEAMYTSHNYG